MSGQYYHPFPPTVTHNGCPSCHCSHLMLPNKVARYPAEDDMVSLSMVYDLLDDQEHYFWELIQQQERNYRAFLQFLMDTSSSRMDNLVREMQDLRNCLQQTKTELAEVKKLGVQNGKRAECLAEGLVMVRGALDGLSLKTGAGGGGVGAGGGGVGGRGLDLKQGRGAGALKLDGIGVGGRVAKKTEPKAVKLVADLTEIHFEDFKVVHKYKESQQGLVHLLFMQFNMLSPRS